MSSTTITFGKLEATTGFLAAQEARTALAVCSGLSNKEIARVMDCAPDTVKKTIARVFYKIRVSSRSALVAEVFRLGLVAFTGNMMPAPQRHEEDDTNQGVFVA